MKKIGLLPKKRDSRITSCLLSLMVICLMLFVPDLARGQTKQYAVSQSNGKNSAGFILSSNIINSGYSSTSNALIADVENPGRAVDENETTAATMKARNISLI